MTGILLTQSTTPIISQVAWILGKLMNWIYVALDSLFNIQNIALCIIIFTIIVYMCMLPLQIKQQKFTRMSAMMNPEIQAIQKKYKNKKDQASLQKQQEETQAVYAKYGTSPTGSCVQLVVQMPILFGLYQVIRNVPAYVDAVKNEYMPLVNGIMNTTGFQSKMEKIGSVSPINIKPESFDYGKVNTLIDVLYKFQTDTWDALNKAFPALHEVINTTKDAVANFNDFLGINIANAPLTIVKENFGSKNMSILAIVVAIAIPIVSGLTQYLSIQMSQAGNTMDSDNPMASSMKTMNTTMPLFSVFMCFTLPAGLGIYWVASAVVRTIQMVVINKFLDRESVEELVKENQEKAKKKLENKKEKVDHEKINEMAQKKTRTVSISEDELNKKLEASEAARSNAKDGSLASKANMVKKYNENK
ncbi:MAG: YidC/Oxa1 family membrane protein insertase [Lachnospiraceae bacterium]|nr:YidC/Oxa1 family membrane protein insertase [Lachnospiraceae bacterium]